VNEANTLNKPPLMLAEKLTTRPIRKSHTPHTRTPTHEEMMIEAKFMLKKRQRNTRKK
jgi:hypothetical protein